MQRFSGAIKEQFDLSGVLPVLDDPASRGSHGSDAKHIGKPRADYFYRLLIILSAALIIFGRIMSILDWMDQ